MEYKTDMRIILTGASGGIGAALTHLLADEINAQLLLVGRNTAKLKELANEFPNQIDILSCDLQNPDSISDIFAWVDNHWAQLDALIHNAAPPVSGDPATAIKHTESADAFQVGPIVALDLIREASTRMRKGARILLTSSGAGHNGFAGMPAYCGAKFALEGITQAVAEDLWKQGISIDTIALPSVKTEFSRPHFDKDLFEQFPEPDQVLNPFRYLLASQTNQFSGRSLFLHEKLGEGDTPLPPIRKYRAKQMPLTPPSRQDLRAQGLTNQMAKVDLGEAPFPPSPRVAEAVAHWMQQPDSQEYPDAKCRELKQALATRHQLNPEQILPGPGSSEILAWLLDQLVDPGCDVISGSFCFRVWSWMVQSRGIRHIIYHNQQETHDLIQIITKITPQTRLIYIDSPSNPMGDVILEEQFRYFMQRLPAHIWVIVDHAYQDFVVESKGLDTTTREWLTDPRILSVRTLSKSHAMAAWRIGYLAAHPKTIETIAGSIIPFTLSTPAQIAAQAVLDDTIYTDKLRMHYINERKRIRAALDEQNIPYWIGETSFTSVFWPGVSHFYQKAVEADIAIPHADNDMFFIAAIRDEESNNRVIRFLIENYPEEHKAQP